MDQGSLVSQLAVARFLELYLEDQAKGAIRELDAYQARFPEVATLVAEEYRELQGPPSVHETQGLDPAWTTSRLDGDIGEQLRRDLGAGLEPLLGDYLERFPGRELEVADAFAHLGEHQRGPAGPSPSMPETLGGYRLIRELGRGGQATVYLGHDARLDRHVAVKVFMASTLLPTSSARQRFKREALTAARLDHPNLCAVYEVGEEGPLAFIAMRFVPGVTLGDRLAAHRARTPNSSSRIPALLEPDAVDEEIRNNTWERITRILGMLEELARAVHVAHEAGILHRDIKPGNVILNPEGSPVLVDFGLALSHDDESFPNLTRTGELLGTPRYMSPEQVRADDRPLDRRTDVYSLAVTLYECLVGHGPFEPVSIQALYREILTKEAPRVDRLNSAIPEDLGIVLEVALEKDPDRRYATALEFAEDLRRVQEHQPIIARSASAVYQARKFARRHRGLVGGAVATLLASLIGATVAIFYAMEANRAAELANQREADATLLTYQTVLASAIRSLEKEDFVNAATLAGKLPESHAGWEAKLLRAHLDYPIKTLDTGLGWGPVPIGFLDGERAIAVVSREGEGLLIDVESEKTLVHLGPAAERYSLQEELGIITSFSPDRAIVHEIKTQRQITSIPLPGLQIYFAQVAEETLLLLAEQGLQGYDIRSGEQLFVRWPVEWHPGTGPPKDERGVYWSYGLESWGGTEPGAVFVSGDGDHKYLEVVDFRTGELLRESKVDEFGIIHAIAMSPDEKALAVVGDKALTLFQLPSLERIQTFRHHPTYMGSMRSYRGGLSFADGGQTLLLSRNEKTLLGLDTLTGDVAMRLVAPFPVTEAKLSASGHQLLCGVTSSNQRIHTRHNGSPLRRVLREHPSYVYALAFHPSLSWMATGDYEGNILIWDLAEGDVLARISAGTRLESMAELWFSEDGHWIVARSRETIGPLLAWNLITGEHREFEDRQVPECPKAPAGTLLDSGVGLMFDETPSAPKCLSWDGEFIAMAHSVKPLLTVSAASSGETLKSWNAHEGGTRSIAWSHHGRWLATGGRADLMVRLWTWPEAQLLVEIPAVDSGQIYSVQFHPDDSRLVTSGLDGVVRLWDTANFKPVAELRGHTDYVHANAFSPDGSILVSTSGDHSVSLWDSVPRHRRRASAAKAAIKLEELRPLVESAFETQGDALTTSRQLLEQTDNEAEARVAIRRLLLERALRQD